jgi:3-deoxy-manno-octulosonate cytidylyltransferase (CMP-KDO synthetase)
MRTAIVIPARYNSTRLPAKPLLKSTGKYLIQHVYEAACQSETARYVMIATDDSRIAAAADTFGGNYVMTRSDHVSGTDRVAEVAQDLDVDVVVNLQGDEPEVDPAALDLLPALLERHPDADVATLAVPIANVDEWASPSCVKVVCDRWGKALYFSRSPIPFVREGRPNFHARPARFLRHLGLYAYRREFLLRLAELPADPLEESERLEQLRWLSDGSQIHVGLVHSAGCGVDTLEEYESFVRRSRSRHAALAA